jgi:hypothetical protein
MTNELNENDQIIVSLLGLIEPFEQLTQANKNLYEGGNV